MAEEEVDKRGEPVAFFDLYRRKVTEGEEAFQITEGRIPIYANQEFYVGRSKSCRYQCFDPTISNQHLHVHCIIYEEDAVSGIPPLVYAEDLSTNGTYLSNYLDREKIAEKRIGRKGGRTLLKKGDRLRIGSEILLAFVQESGYHSQPSLGLNELQQRESQLFQDRFAITNQKIGAGGHGTVFVAIHKKSSRQVACKVVDLVSYEDEVGRKDPLAQVGCSVLARAVGPIQDQVREHQEQLIQNHPQFREFEVLKDLDHPNIIRLEKVFWSTDTLYIFQELITGGDLFSFIEYKGGRLSDVEAAVVLRQILLAIEYLHAKDIVHRDLKPDNILMTSWEDGARVVLTDFGNARRLIGATAAVNNAFTTRRRMFSVVGTLEYTAPEIHRKNSTMERKQGYSKSVDMWSIGIIATALFTGDVIFTNRMDPNYEKNPSKVILNLAAKCDLSIIDNPNSTWRLVGKRPKDFVKKLLVLEEEKRMTVQQALAHEWFTNNYHCHEFAAVYQRAIQDWEPRRKMFRPIEALGLSRRPRKVNHAVDEGGHNDSRSSHHFATPYSEFNLTPKSYSGAFGKRVHTPLPKIDEENIAGLCTSSMPYSEAQTPASEHILEVENSMSQLALAALSEAGNEDIPDSQLEASLMNPSGTSMDSFMGSLDEAQLDRVGPTPLRQHSSLQSSSVTVAPPFSPSSGKSGSDIVSETPPCEHAPTNRKKRSSPTSEDLCSLGDEASGLDTASFGGPVQGYQSKRMRVA